MPPKFKNSDARNSDMPKKGPNMLLLIEKVKVLSKKKMYAEVDKIHGKNKSSTCEIVKEKEICASSAVAKVMAKVCEKYLGKVEKALNLWLKDINRKHIPTQGKVLENTEPIQTKITASGPIASWQIDGETVGTVSGFIFLGSKITADGDCSHGSIRCLLLERKVMTKLDNMLKSRDITLSTKVGLVKAMVFLVVMYGCESWTIKKA